MNSFDVFLKKNENKLGFIGAILGIIMFISLIEVFISNIQDSSQIFIQPLATGINGTIWCLYAYSRKDWFLFIPNVLACALGFITALSGIL